MAIVEQCQNSEDGSPRLRIHTPNREDAIFTLPGGLVSLSEGLGPDLTKDNLLHSNFLYLAPALKSEAGYPALLFAGHAYASDPGSCCILQPDAHGSPQVIFKSDTFDLTALQELEQSGRPSLIGKETLSESLGSCLMTYDPFAVYRVPSQGEAVYDPELSKAYNLAHYYGWAGRRKDDSLLVATCAPEGKPKVLPAAEAHRLYDDPGDSK